MKILLLLGLVAVAACGSSGAGSSDGGPTCVYEGDAGYVCHDGQPSEPACPTGVASFQACTLGAHACMFCSEGVGAICNCGNVPPDGGKRGEGSWLCAGTGYTCE